MHSRLLPSRGPIQVLAAGADEVATFDKGPDQLQAARTLVEAIGDSELLHLDQTIVLLGCGARFGYGAKLRVTAC